MIRAYQRVFKTVNISKVKKGKGIVLCLLLVLSVSCKVQHKAIHSFNAQCINGFWEEKDNKWVGLLFLDDHLVFSFKDSLDRRINIIPEIYDIAPHISLFYYQVKHDTLYAFDEFIYNWKIIKVSCNNLMVFNANGDTLNYIKSPNQNTPVYVSMLDTLVSFK